MKETSTASLSGNVDVVEVSRLARGLQLAGVDLPNRKISPESKPHLDLFRRLAAWP